MTPTPWKKLTTQLAVAALALGTFAAVQLPQPARADDAVKPALTTKKVALKVTPASSAQSVEGRKQLALLNADKTEAFTMLGVTWKSQSGTLPTVQYRVKTVAAKGAWSPWQRMDVDNDTDAGQGGSEPVFTEKADGYQLRVLGADDTQVSGVNLSVINSDAIAQDTSPALKTQTEAGAAEPGALSPAAAWAGVPRPSIISRAGWGANESLRATNGRDCLTPDIDDTIAGVVVHHTAGSNTYTAAQSASIVRGIYQFHVVDRGWCDIGYNVLIDKYGQKFEGRAGGLDAPVHGAHAGSWNTNTIGVSFMMNSDSLVPPEAAYSAAVQVIAWKLANNYHLANDSVTIAGKTVPRIFGHGDVMATGCPGTNIRKYLPTLRARVATTMGAWKNSVIYQRYADLGGSPGPLGVVHILERPYSTGRVTDFVGGTIWAKPDGSTAWANSWIGIKARALGFNTTGWIARDQVNSNTRERAYADFANGRIYTNSRSSAWVTGRMLSAIKSNSSIIANAGFPTGDAKTTPAGITQQFEKGLVTLRADNSVVIASGRFGDRNVDSRADLLATTSTGALVWRPTNTSGTTGGSEIQIGRGWGTTTWLGQVPDQNGDGLVEMLARRSDGSLWMYTSVSATGYSTGMQVGKNWNAVRSMVVLPDITGDGRPDLFAIDTLGRLMTYTVNPSGGLSGTRQVGKNWQSIRMLATVGQFTGDSRADLLAVTSTGELRAYTLAADGTASGTASVGRGWGGFTHIVSVGDLNGDGRRDLLGRNSNGDIHAYLNNGNGSWNGTGVYARGPGYVLMG